MISHECLLELIDYLPESGFFIWKLARGNMKAGHVAGKLHKSRSRKNYVYLAITIAGKEYAAHRLAWYYVTGEMPPPEVHIDHRDGSSLNNKWENLRKSDHTCNQWNRGAYSTGALGRRGVTRLKNGRYRVRISQHRKRIEIGTFDDPETAEAAYKKASEELHGEFACR